MNESSAIVLQHLEQTLAQVPRTGKTPRRLKRRIESLARKAESKRLLRVELLETFPRVRAVVEQHEAARKRTLDAVAEARAKAERSHTFIGKLRRAFGVRA